ncbi:MAG: YbhB/YbcL family Raf kinase inhibitor-like protein [Rickettsiales bacterium]
MKKFTSKTLLFTACIYPFSQSIAAESIISVTSNDIKHEARIAEKFAFCKADGKGKAEPSSNISPHISWSGAPKATKSFALIVVDPDVPAKFDDANKEGKVIAKDFPRKNFYHWIVTDIPVSVTELKEGEGKNIAQNLSAGKELFSYKNGGVPAINDYASFMKDKPRTEFLGYDGPCPPWNDSRIHNYHFTIYALDTEKLDTDNVSSNEELANKIAANSIAKGIIVGTYSNYKK